MPSLLDHARRQRRELLRADRELAASVSDLFGESYGRIRSHLGDLARDISAARARAEAVDALWLARSWRLREAVALTGLEVRSFSLRAGRLVAGARAAALTRAAADTRELVAVARPGDAARPYAFDPAAAASDPGRAEPLLEQLGPAAAARVLASVTAGVAAGAGARELAAEAALTLGLALTHALSVARTSHMTSYREGARAARLADPENVTGWVWVAELSETTCELCWAMHGTVHGPEDVMDSHWNCRCQALPIVRGAEEVIETGEELFERLPDDEKREVLGDAAFEAYGAGRVTLKDFVGRRRPGPFGRMRYVRSLKQVLG